MMTLVKKHRIFLKCISLCLSAAFLSTNTLIAAPPAGEECYALAPQSEAKKNRFEEIVSAVRALEAKKGTHRPAAPAPSAETALSDRREAEAPISEMVLQCEALYTEKKYYDSFRKLTKAQARLSDYFPAHDDLYKEVLALGDDIRKGMLLDQMSDSFRRAFEDAAEKPLSGMTLDELETALAEFNAVQMRDRNRAEAELIERDGVFDVKYVHEQFLDPRNDRAGKQQEIWRRKGIVVSGDGLVILRGVSGDVFIFQMDAMGHGYRSALLLNIIVPYLYKRWERGAEGFLTDDLFEEASRLVCEYGEMKDAMGSFVTMNAVHISAADGRTEYYSLGNEPALLVSGRGRVEPIMSEGAPVGMTAEQPVTQKVESTLKKGNRLILCSDGVTESRLSGSALYGAENLKELINRYIAEVHTLPAEKAADEVIKKVQSVAALAPDEEAQLKAHIVERFADYSSYGDDLKEALAKNPKLSPEELNTLALSDIRDKAGIAEELRLWNEYVAARLDVFLDGCAEDLRGLYGAVLEDFKSCNGLEQLRVDSYAGNSLRLLGFIQERMRLPRDQVVDEIKKHHKLFSNLPVSAAEIASDDLTLVSVLYKGKSTKGKAPAPGTKTGTLTIRFSGADSEPAVTGDAHAGIIAQLAQPHTPNGILVRSLLKKAGTATVAFFSGKRLSYVQDGVIYINERLVADAGLQGPGADKAAGSVTAQEQKQLRAAQNAAVALQFLLCAKLAELGREGRVSRQAIERSVSYYTGLSRKDQDRLIAGLKNYRKDDPEADGYYRLFTTMLFGRSDDSIAKEKERLVKLCGVVSARDGMNGALDDIAAGKPRWDSLIRKLRDMSGTDAVDAGMETAAQECLTRVWTLLSDEKTRPAAETDREAAGRAAKKVMREIVSRKNDIRKAEEQKVPFLQSMQEVGPRETSYCRSFFLPNLLDGTMAVKGLQFVKTGENGCKVKKGRRVYGSVPSLNDMRVYRQGTTEYVVLDIKDGHPVVLEINILAQEASIVQYAGAEPFMLFPPRDIEIKKPKVSTSGISIRRMAPEQPVYLIADGTLNRSGEFTVTKVYDASNIPRKIPSLMTEDAARLVREALARALQLYPRPADIALRFVCGNDRSSASVMHMIGNNLIVVDVEDLGNRDLLFMDIEEELLHLAMSDMPPALRPPLAMEEVMTALLKVYRFRTLSPDQQKGVLELLQSQENDLDDQGFYRLLSLPAALSLNGLLEEIVRYIGRPGVYPDDVTAYLFGRSVDDVIDELYGRAAGKDGRKTNSFQTIFEMFPKEVVSPAVVAAKSLPIEELFNRLYRTDHERLLSHIFSNPPEFLGITAPLDKYRALQAEFREFLLKLDPKVRIKETLALMVVCERLTGAADRERFARACRSAGTVSLGYEIFKSGAAVPGPAEKRDAAGEAVVRIAGKLKRGGDISDELSDLLKIVRGGILKGLLDNEKVEKIALYLKSEGDKWFATAGRADLINAVRFYQAVSSLCTVPDQKYGAYDRAQAFFNRLVDRDGIREPAELKKLRPRLTAAFIDRSGVYTDRTLEDIVEDSSESDLESPAVAQNLKLLLGYYGLDFAQFAFMKRNFHKAAAIFVFDGARRPGPKKLYFGETRNGHLDLSKVTPRSYDNFYDGIIEPGRISTKNRTQVENDPKVRRLFELFLEFEQFHGFRFGALYYDYYLGKLVSEEPSYRRKKPVYEAVDLAGRVIDERTGYQIREQALNYGETGKEKEIEQAVRGAEAFVKEVNDARERRKDGIVLDRFSVFEADVIPFGALSSIADFAACKDDPLAFEKLSEYISKNAGGKGMSLQVMKALGLDVPDGFTIAAKNYKKYKDSLAAKPASEVRARDIVDYETQLKSILSDTSLVSVRSGAPVSLPGLLDTVLNVGLTPGNAETFRKANGFSEEYVLDLYRIFLRGFAASVFGMYDQQIERLMATAEKDLQVLQDAEGKPVPLGRRIDEYAKTFARESGRSDALPILHDPRRQVDEAVKAVFSSWDSPEAASYRKEQGIADDIGTAVNVQQMVFGKPGVAFSRDRITGENIVTGRIGNIVGGEESGEGIEALEKGLQAALRDQVKILERLFRDVQDVEFVVDTAGKIHFLQSRTGKKTAAAAAKVAADMVREGILDTYSAARQVTADQLRALLANPVIDYGSPAVRAHNGSLAVRNESGGILKGDPVSSGVVTGVLAFSAEKVKELKEKGIPAILVKRDFELTDDSIEAIRQADGVIAVDGSDSSHGAQIATSFGKPAIVNMPDLIFRDGEIIVTGMSEYRTKDGARLSGEALTRYVMKSGRKLGDLIKDGALTVELKKFVEGDIITIDGTTGQVYECVVDEKGAIVKSVMTVPPKDNVYLNALLEPVAAGVPAGAFAAPLPAPAVPAVETKAAVMQKFQRLLARVGIYGKGEELEAAFKSGVKRVATDISSGSKALEFDYTGLPASTLQRWWQYLAAKIETSLKNARYAYDDVSLDDFLRFVTGFRDDQPAPLSALPVLQHDINTEAVYAVDRGGKLVLSSETEVFLGPFLPVYAGMKDVLADYFRGELSSGEIRKIRVVKRLREGADVSITNGELVIPMDVFGNEELLPRWLGFVRARERGEIGDPQIDRLISEDRNTIVDFNAAADREGNRRLVLDPAFEAGLGKYVPVYLRRARMIEDYFNRVGWPAGLNTIRIERLIKYGAHVEKPKGLMVFPLDILKSSKKFEFEALPHEKRHFEIHEDREVEEALNVALDILAGIMPLKRADSAGYDVLLMELAADDARARNASNAYLPRLDRLIERNAGKPEGFEYQYEKKMRERQLSGDVMPYHVFVESVVSKAEKMRREGAREEDIERAVAEAAFAYIVKNEGIYPYESNMLRIRGSKEVSAKVSALLKKYRAPDWYEQDRPGPVPAQAAAKKWWEVIPWADFVARNMSKALFITVLAVGMNLVFAAPASAFDGKTLLAGASTAGVVFLNILIFSIIFTVISSIFPVNGLFLNLLLNLAFLYGYKRYYAWKQEKPPPRQYEPPPPVRAAPRVVKPAAKVIEKTKTTTVYKMPKQPSAVEEKAPPKGRMAKIISFEAARRKLRGEDQPPAGEAAGQAPPAETPKSEAPRPEKKQLVWKIGELNVNLAACTVTTLAILAKADGNPYQEAARAELLTRTPKNDKEKKMIDGVFAPAKTAAAPQKKARLETGTTGTDTARTPRLWESIYRSMARLTSIFGFFWPLMIGIGLVKASPVLAMMPAAVPQGAQAVSQDTLMAEIFAAGLFLSAVLYAGFSAVRALRKRAEADKALMSIPNDNEMFKTDWGSKLWQEFMKSPMSKPLRDVLQMKYENSKVVLAAFRAEKSARGIAFVLEDEFRDGKNAVSARKIKELGLSMEGIEESVADIGRMIEKEPNGREVNRIVILDKENVLAHIRKDSNTIYFVASILNSRELLEMHLIPHEVYHTVVEGEIAVEELLVHALTFVRACNTFRKGKSDPGLRRRFDVAMKKAAELEAQVNRGDKPTQVMVIDDLIKTVQELEAKERRELSSEEVLEMALPRTIAYMRDNSDLFETRNIAQYVANLTDGQLLAEAKKMWDAQRGSMLRGRPLFAHTFPLLLLDFSEYLTDAPNIQFILRGLLIGSMLVTGGLLRPSRVIGGAPAGTRMSWDALVRTVLERFAGPAAKQIPAPELLFRDGVTYIPGLFIGKDPGGGELDRYARRIKLMAAVYPGAYLNFLIAAGLLHPGDIAMLKLDSGDASRMEKHAAGVLGRLNKKYIVDRAIASSGLKNVPEVYDLFTREKAAALKKADSAELRQGLGVLERLLLGEDVVMTGRETALAVFAAVALGLLGALAKPPHTALLAETLEPYLIYDDMVSREEGFSDFNPRPDRTEGDLDVTVLHVESFYLMRYDDTLKKQVPLLKDLGGRILLEGLMKGRQEGSTRKFVWVATTADGLRIRKLAGLPAADHSVDPSGFTGDLSKLETDPDTARRFIEFVEADVSAALRKGTDAEKELRITVVTESKYYDSIWRKSVRVFIFAILMGDDALPSSAIAAVFGQDIPEELKDCIDAADPAAMRILPKTVVRDMNYLDELARQNAELAVSA